MAKKRTRPLVAVDPGHGGADPGTLSSSGVREADLNLALAQRFREATTIDDVFDVLLLRDADESPSLADRVAAANIAGAAAVLSFHCNFCWAPTVRGFEVWTSPGVTLADGLATCIYNELAFALPYPGRPDVDDGDPDREARFYMLRKTKAPAVLIEFGFLSNHGDCVWLSEPANQVRAAVAVEFAVMSWLLGWEA